jgi:hypothetical protein
VAGAAGAAIQCGDTVELTVSAADLKDAKSHWVAAYSPAGANVTTTVGPGGYMFIAHHVIQRFLKP